jgi:hypothetical protein
VTCLTGKAILQRQLVQGGNRYRSGVFNLPRGAYFISIQEGLERVYHRKQVSIGISHSGTIAGKRIVLNWYLKGRIPCGYRL